MKSCVIARFIHRSRTMVRFLYLITMHSTKTYTVRQTGGMASYNKLPATLKLEIMFAFNDSIIIIHHHSSIIIIVTVSQLICMVLHRF